MARSVRDQTTARPVRKKLLYFAPSRAHSDSLLAALSEQLGATRIREDGATVLRLGDTSFRFVLRQDPLEAHEALHRE